MFGDAGKNPASPVQPGRGRSKAAKPSTQPPAPGAGAQVPVVETIEQEEVRIVSESHSEDQSTLDEGRLASQLLNTHLTPLITGSVGVNTRRALAQSYARLPASTKKNKKGAAKKTLDPKYPTKPKRTPVQAQPLSEQEMNDLLREDTPLDGGPNDPPLEEEAGLTAAQPPHEESPEIHPALKAWMAATEAKQAALQKEVEANKAQLRKESEEARLKLAAQAEELRLMANSRAALQRALAESDQRVQALIESSTGEPQGHTKIKDKPVDTGTPAVEGLQNPYAIKGVEKPYDDDMPPLHVQQYHWAYRAGIMLSDHVWIRYYNDILDNIENGSFPLSYMDNPNMVAELKAFRAQYQMYDSHGTPLPFSDATLKYRLEQIGFVPPPRRVWPGLQRHYQMTTKDFITVYDQDAREVPMDLVVNSPHWDQPKAESYVKAMRDMIGQWLNALNHLDLVEGTPQWVPPPVGAYDQFKCVVGNDGSPLRFTYPESPVFKIPTTMEEFENIARNGFMDPPRPARPDQRVHPVNLLPTSLPAAPALPQDSGSGGTRPHTPHSGGRGRSRTPTPDGRAPADQQQPQRMAAARAPRQGGGSYAQAAGHQVSLGGGLDPFLNDDDDDDDPMTGAHIPDLDTPEPKRSSEEDQYKKFIDRLQKEHPNLIKGPKKMAQAIGDNLLSILHPNDVMQSGSRVFIQAPVIPVYSGRQDPNFNEQVWFSQVVQHARSTNQSLIHSLIAHTSEVALRWATLLQMHDREAFTQDRRIREGTLTMINGTLKDAEGHDVEQKQPYTEDEIAQDFGRQFLAYKQDDVQKSRLLLEQNLCQQKQNQTLEDFIVDFRTLLMEAQINTTDKKCQLSLVIHFFNGLLPAYKKHGHNDYNSESQTAFTNLSKYWDFLRKQVQKDEAKKLVEAQVRQTTQQGKVNGVQPYVQYTDAEKAAYKLKRKADREAQANSKKRQYTDNSASNANKRQKTTQGQQQYPQRDKSAQQQQQVKTDHLLEGEFKWDKLWHTGMPTLTPQQRFPEPYPNGWPTQPLNQDTRPSFRLGNVYTSCFPDPKYQKVLKSCLARQEQWQKNQKLSLDEQHKYDKLCIFHGSLGHHSSYDCACYLCHYPNGMTPAVPQKNIPRNQ